ncbi:universal stress protein [Arenibacter latericius]|uniref:universal stress protein n=1 Tax=Arenibacter latericius TaxID=86104 RepID=UPI000403F4DD|nr:universal stress protein [Arenibacter latericius]MDX1363198.1 universal stress protein [Arenibacter latericius]
MMNTIFYATDRSEREVPVLKNVYNLSVELGAKLVVFYVHRMEPLRVSVSRPIQQIEYHVIREQKEILEAYCREHIGAKFNPENVVFEVVEGDSITKAILEKSKEYSADLIVIGRKEKHSERGLFVGDIGKELQDKVTCPLLIAPNIKEKSSINTILYATDFEEADIIALQDLASMAKLLDAKIEIVHISTEKEYAGEQQLEWFKEMLEQKVDYENIAFKLYFSDDIEAKLRKLTEEINADILVLLERKEKKGFFQRIFHKSLVKKMESHIAIPLMSYNEVKICAAQKSTAGKV